MIQNPTEGFRIRRRIYRFVETPRRGVSVRILRPLTSPQYTLPSMREPRSHRPGLRVAGEGYAVMLTGEPEGRRPDGSPVKIMCGGHGGRG